MELNMDEISKRLDAHDSALVNLIRNMAELQENTKDLPELIANMNTLLSERNKKNGQSHVESVHGDSGEEEETLHHNRVIQEYNLVNRLTKLEFPTFDGENFKDWRYKCEFFFELDHTPEAMKIGLVSIYLKDKALQWHRAFLKELQGKHISWKSYLAELRERFTMGNISKPLIELKHLKMTSTVQEYNHEFNVLRNQVEVPNELLLDMYLEGLPNEFLHTFQIMEPKSINHAMRLAKLHENACYALGGLELEIPNQTLIFKNDTSELGVSKEEAVSSDLIVLNEKNSDPSFKDFDENRINEDMEVVLRLLQKGKEEHNVKEEGVLSKPFFAVMIFDQPHLVPARCLMKVLDQSGRENQRVLVFFGVMFVVWGRKPPKPPDFMNNNGSLFGISGYKSANSVVHKFIDATKSKHLFRKK